MLKDLSANDGVLKVDDPTYFKSLVASANRYGKVPEGKILEIRHKSWREPAEVALVDQPEWMTATLEAVPVSARLLRPHPAVATIAGNRESRLLFKSVVRQRALRLLDAIAKECERRGYAVRAEQRLRGGQSHPGDLLVEIQGHSHRLEVREQNDRVPHVPSAQEQRNAERYTWQTIPTHDSKPSGRLEIRIHGGAPIRADTFADTKTLTLEERLAVLVQELELRAAQSERQRLDREDEAAKKREAWERIREDAVAAFHQSRRAQVLEEQAARWVRVSQMRSYLEAMSARASEMAGEERTATVEWLAWGQGYMAEVDPLTQRLALPTQVEPKPEELKPFMKGHSPYGPNAW